MITILYLLIGYQGLMHFQNNKYILKMYLKIHHWYSIIYIMKGGCGI